jgi:Uncharacterized homolog of phage Mu protein gp47
MTYNQNTAEVEPRTQQEWLDLLLEDGSEHWGEDITEREGTYIHRLYEPFADRLAELEEQLQTVQHSLRLEDATGQALDYLGERLGVSRRKDKKAVGQVTFSASAPVDKDYVVQKGTRLSTEGQDSIVFVVANETVLNVGDSQVTTKVEAKETGSQGNVAANTITRIAGSILGVDSITNPQATKNGRDIEVDDVYRDRIQATVGASEITSLKRLYEALNMYQYVEQVRPLDNSTKGTQSGLDPYQVEVIVDAEAGHKDEIAQTILENTAAGAEIVGGVNGTKQTGTAELTNGQQFTMPFSTPEEVPIYTTVDVVVSTPTSKQAIKDSIIEYIGGVKTNGEQIYGELGIAENVLAGEIDFAARELENVYDIEAVKVGKTSSPTGTTNLTIQSNQRAATKPANIVINTSLKQ